MADTMLPELWLLVANHLSLPDRIWLRWTCRATYAADRRDLPDTPRLALLQKAWAHVYIGEMRRFRPVFIRLAQSDLPVWWDLVITTPQAFEPHFPERDICVTLPSYPHCKPPCRKHVYLYRPGWGYFVGVRYGHAKILWVDEFPYKGYDLF